MQRLIPALLLCTLSVSAFAESSACHPANGREIQVNGSGSVALAPDQVSFSLGVESRSRKVAEAFRSNTERANAIIATLKKRGVKGEEIQTSNLTIQSYSEHDGSEVSYIVTNRITITRKELTTIGELIQAGVEQGANQADSLHFSVADSREARKLALQRAFEDAHDKAQQLATLAGRQLGEAVCIHDQGEMTPQPLAYAMKAERFAVAPTIESGMQQLTHTIGVVFELK